MSENIDNIIDKNEEVLWRDKPDKISYVFSALNVFLVIFMIIWTSMVYFITSGFGKFQSDFPTMRTQFLIFEYMPYLFYLIPITVLVINPIYRFFAAGKIEYVITDKRIYIISGIIGTDIQNVEYREVDKLNVSVGFMEKLRSTGTISLTPDVKVNSGRDSSTTVYGHKLIGISNPYQVYKLLRDNSLDVTTDQYYPNDLRPDNNKGYKTKLDR